MIRPEVSVLMPVRNGARFLDETIQSLRQQTLKDVEFIVVDDGSADATPQMLAKWAQDDIRVRIIALKAGQSNGLADVLNIGAREARAPFIARADADDVYHPDRLALQLARMQADETLVALSCGFRRIDADGNLISIRNPIIGPETIAFVALFQSALLHPGAMIRATALAQIGGYDTAYWTAQDSDLWARLIAAGGRLDNLPDVLVDYRIHGTSVMKTRGPEGQALSLSIPARMQHAYLGGAPAVHDPAAVVALYQSNTLMAPDTLRRGVTGAWRIMQVARQKEASAAFDFVAEHFLVRLEQQLAWCPRRKIFQKRGLTRNVARWRKMMARQ